MKVRELFFMKTFPNFVQADAFEVDFKCHSKHAGKQKKPYQYHRPVGVVFGQVAKSKQSKRDENRKTNND